MFNKKGNMFTGNVLFVLMSIFGVGLLVLLVINPALKGYISPALLATTTGAMNAMLAEKYTFIIGMIDIMPYAIFLIGIIYLLVIIFRQEKVSYYE